jgi:hypothetical protein
VTGIFEKKHAWRLRGSGEAANQAKHQRGTWKEVVHVWDDSETRLDVESVPVIWVKPTPLHEKSPPDVLWRLIHRYHGRRSN